MDFPENIDRCFNFFLNMIYSLKEKIPKEASSISPSIFQRTLLLQIVGSHIVQKWGHCTLYQTFLKLCMVEPKAITVKKQRHPRWICPMV